MHFSSSGQSCAQTSHSIDAPPPSGSAMNPTVDGPVSSAVASPVVSAPVSPGLGPSPLSELLSAPLLSLPSALPLSPLVSDTDALAEALAVAPLSSFSPQATIERPTIHPRIFIVFMEVLLRGGSLATRDTITRASWL
jgi:hypothetical protein